VKNPFRTEAEAFRFVITTIVYFGLIVFAALAGTVWWGIGVFVALSVVGALWLFHVPDQAGARPVQAVPTHRSPRERRILVVANESVLGRALEQCIREKTAGYEGRVLVVAPALNTPVRHWTSDEDGARDDARQRLDSSLAALRGAGIEADGEIGDGDPLQALEDALRTFGPDEVIISTHPEGRSHWLERGIVGAARERFAVPVTHVVVDLEKEQEEVR
jgi:hypothetical protein